MSVTIVIRDSHSHTAPKAGQFRDNNQPHTAMIAKTVDRVVDDILSPSQGQRHDVHTPMTKTVVQFTDNQPHTASITKTVVQ